MSSNDNGPPRQRRNSGRQTQRPNQLPNGFGTGPHGTSVPFPPPSQQQQPVPPGFIRLHGVQSPVSLGPSSNRAEVARSNSTSWPSLQRPPFLRREDADLSMMDMRPEQEMPSPSPNRQTLQPSDSYHVQNEAFYWQLPPNQRLIAIQEQEATLSNGHEPTATGVLQPPIGTTNVAANSSGQLFSMWSQAQRQSSPSLTNRYQYSISDTWSDDTIALPTGNSSPINPRTPPFEPARQQENPDPRAHLPRMAILRRPSGEGGRLLDRMSGYTSERGESSTVPGTSYASALTSSALATHGAPENNRYPQTNGSAHVELDGRTLVSNSPPLDPNRMTISSFWDDSSENWRPPPNTGATSSSSSNSPPSNIAGPSTRRADGFLRTPPTGPAAMSPQPPAQANVGGPVPRGHRVHSVLRSPHRGRQRRRDEAPRRGG
ncbi:hypothetical protein QBC44DRAFT_368439 [Cladorrhinum sp. PSN332]|nr:hypothetical protein QBC44DRAFT_368439 [Cladorrhinum sp. PSN332]